MSAQPNNPQQKNLPVSADSVQSVQPQPKQYPLRVNVAEQWTGNTVARQTAGGQLTFVGWADPGRHYEVWQDASGRQYVRNVGGSWYRGEDVAKAQAESQRMLQQVNVLETQYNPQLNSVPQRYFREGDKWFTLEYNPQTSQYNKVEVQAEKLQEDIFSKLLGAPSVNISGYNLPDVGKIAEREPHAFTWYGPEYAERYAKLRETFPELQKEKWITEADVQHVVSGRLEKYGWTPDTREKYEQLRELSFGVLHNPDVWNYVQADLDRQLAEAEKRMKELQRFYEAKVLKQWEAESEAKTNEYMSRLYGNREHWFQVLTGQTGSSFLQQMSFGLLGGPSQFQQKLYGALGVLGSKANIDETMFKAGIQVMRGLSPASFFGTDLLGLDLSSAIKASFGLKNLATGKASLSTGEAAYIKAVSQDFTPQNLAAYMVGSGLGSGLAMYLQGKMIESIPEAIRFTKWEFSEGLAGRTLEKIGIEPKMPEFLSNISGTLKTKAINIGEKIGLVEKVDYVPTRAEVDVTMIKEGGEERAIFKTSLGDFKPAQEVLGVKQVPLEYRVSGSDVSLLKLRPDYEGAVFKEVKYIGEEPVFGGPATYRGFDTGLNMFLKISKGETMLPPDYLLDFEKWIAEGKAPFANETFYYRVPYEKYVFSSPAEKAEFARFRGAFAYGSPSESQSIIAVGKPLEKIEPEFATRAGRYGGQIDYSELIEKLGGYKPQVPKTINIGAIVSKTKKASFEFNYFWKITFPEKVTDIFEGIGSKLKEIIGFGKEAKEVPSEWQPIKIESETPTQFAPPQGFKPTAGRTGLAELVEESEPAGQVKPLVEPEMKIPVLTKTELAPVTKTAIEFSRFVGPRLPSLYGLTHSFPASEPKIAPTYTYESALRPSQELRLPPLDTFIQPRIRTDVFIGQIQAPRLGEITVPKLDVRLEPWLDTRIEPRIEQRVEPKITPKLIEPTVTIQEHPPPPPPPPPPETRVLPRLPPLPPIGMGTRDAPIPGPRPYGRKEWLVQWFGPSVPMFLSPARRSTRRGRRGGRKK